MSSTRTSGTFEKFNWEKHPLIRKSSPNITACSPVEEQQLTAAIIPFSHIQFFCYWKLSSVCIQLPGFLQVLYTGGFQYKNYGCSRKFFLKISIFVTVISPLLFTYNSTGIISHVPTILQYVACTTIVMCHHVATIVAALHSHEKVAFALHLHCHFNGMKALMVDPTTC